MFEFYRGLKIRPDERKRQDEVGARTRLGRKNSGQTKTRRLGRNQEGSNSPIKVQYATAIPPAVDQSASETAARVRHSPCRREASMAQAPKAVAARSSGRNDQFQATR